MASEVLSKLTAKYPQFSIVSEPSPTCTNCKGSGEYLSKALIWRPCLCICMSGDDELRSLAADALHRKIWRKHNDLEESRESRSPQV